jgi:VIT1/CCC1 family predicted Fe2+/Mn2+ transporter
MADPSALGRLKASLAASAGNIVFGMEDGTVSIFGLVFGVAATTSDSRVVLIAGAAGAFAAAVSMMAGTYLEVETNRDGARTLDARIKAEIARDPGGVIERMDGLLRTGGMTDEQTAAVAGLLRANPLLLQGMATAAAAPTASELTQGPLVQALWMLVADFFSAAIPILPFALMPVAEARWVSGTVTMALLIALGVGRARVGDRPVLRTVIQTVTIGVAAALAGVAIGVGVDRAFGR